MVRVWTERDQYVPAHGNEVMGPMSRLGLRLGLVVVYTQGDVLGV